MFLDINGIPILPYSVLCFYKIPLALPLGWMSDAWRTLSGRKVFITPRTDFLKTLFARQKKFPVRTEQEVTFSLDGALFMGCVLLLAVLRPGLLQINHFDTLFIDNNIPMTNIGAGWMTEWWSRSRSSHSSRGFCRRNRRIGGYLCSALCYVVSQLRSMSWSMFNISPPTRCRCSNLDKLFGAGSTE